jgi:H+-transporting ATPase
VQTLAFVSVAFGSQATIYAIRERRRLWSLRPSRWLILSSAGDLIVSSLLAIFGLLMAPLAWPIVGSVFGAAITFGILLNLIKLPLFARLQIS